MSQSIIKTNDVTDTQISSAKITDLTVTDSNILSIDGSKFNIDQISTSTVFTKMQNDLSHNLLEYQKFKRPGRIPNLLYNGSFDATDTWAPAPGWTAANNYSLIINSSTFCGNPNIGPGRSLRISPNVNISTFTPAVYQQVDLAARGFYDNTGNVAQCFFSACYHTAPSQSMTVGIRLVVTINAVDYVATHSEIDSYIGDALTWKIITVSVDPAGYSLPVTSNFTARVEIGMTSASAGVVAFFDNAILSSRQTGR